MENQTIYSYSVATNSDSIVAPSMPNGDLMIGMFLIAIIISLFSRL